MPFISGELSGVGALARHDAQDDAASGRTAVGWWTVVRPTATGFEEHRSGHGAHQRPGTRHRRSNLGQAAAAIGARDRLSRSARNFRLAVAKVKAEWWQKRLICRPWVASRGQRLVIDCTPLASAWLCAVVAWSRYRFLRFASNETHETTLGLLAECFEEAGAVVAVAVSNGMGCLEKGIVPA
jgi:hypothetical protein